MTVNHVFHWFDSSYPSVKNVEGTPEYLEYVAVMKAQQEIKHKVRTNKIKGITNADPKPGSFLRFRHGAVERKN